MLNQLEIIDFHTHPFPAREYNICNYADHCHMGVEDTREVFRTLGIDRICGSVIRLDPQCSDRWAKTLEENNAALKLREVYGDFYIPGFHVHPAYVEESIAEVQRMSKLGVKLVGELVPYIEKWNELDYGSDELHEILNEIGRHNMVVSIHAMDNDAMDKMVKRYPDVIFVAAHPGEKGEFMRHLERARYSDNYLIDISGYGVFRYGMLRAAIDAMGADRVLFGSDFPTCSPAMYLGAVTLDHLITDSEKEKILSLNAKRILGL